MLARAQAGEQKAALAKVFGISRETLCQYLRASGGSSWPLTGRLLKMAAAAIAGGVYMGVFSAKNGLYPMPVCSLSLKTYFDPP